ncbi:P-loop containing nucleoside triphosphate hydrolase protein [Aspergillus granulosus]|uniref:P-loop containing nucleoside triphosphate hydrolase protein n=1 Tax=Aspergillus granulosus TaxID=176169 RepID=A0ABR4GYL7_9EURO
MTSKTRATRLTKIFSNVLDGKHPINTADKFVLLLEAILDQSDHATCVERIIASPSARNAIHTGIRCNTKADFLNKHTASFISYLADPSVRTLCNGQFLQDILEIIIDPCTVWNAFMQAFLDGQLTEPATQSFAWLLVELLTSSSALQIDVVSDAQKVVDNGSLLQSTISEIRGYGEKIRHILQVRSSNTTAITNLDQIPGGRHDNDQANFRQIAIYPTYDEFRSKEKPFYRCMDEIMQLPAGTRVAAHLDNQFRLLREDMLSGIREEVQSATGKKRKSRAASILQGLSLVQVFHGNDSRQHPCGMVFSCSKGLEDLEKVGQNDRATFLDNDRSFLRHDSFGCLLRGQEIVSFAKINRQVNLLLSNPPKIVLRVIGDEAVKKTLLYFKLHNDIQFVFVDTPVFAYEPILRRLQDKIDFPLAEELLEHHPEASIIHSHTIPSSLINDIKDDQTSLQDLLDAKNPISLDPSQRESMLCGLTQRVSLIQGPPGTGKSFVGALLGMTLYKHSKETILVMCYTNHALDQFLEDLLDIGIDSSAIVRLGSKFSSRTEPLSLSAQQHSSRRRGTTWNIIGELKGKANSLRESLNVAFNEYLAFRVTTRALLEFLEFEKAEFFAAFTPPQQDDGMTLIGENGKTISSHYLYDRWSRGKNHSLPSLDHLGAEARRVWEMDAATRTTKIQLWTRNLLDEHVTNVQGLMARLDEYQAKLETIWKETTRNILRSKQIIGCTTTAAAMQAEHLREISPGIVLLEEAGEILESHVITAIGSKTKQLIMIGDHKQLRPKINNYALSVEKGSGYDLNRSLFERLVGSGYPHSTLAKQHRMVPEISCLVRNLTYPNLMDGDRTFNRPAVRGLQDRVIFINHSHPEANFREVSDRLDNGTKGSKRNSFEVQLVLKIVRYLGQQGYGTDKLVVLTPYLGQLHLLREELRKEKDPVLNDLDYHDLVRAGLISQASAQHHKRPIKISTIDNYQGEESDIVIATLTRSNQNGDIGFMSAPQRLNVLLSRARDVLIMIGNSKTFMNSRKGNKVWRPFFDQLQSNGHLYDGLPVKCEQHPQRKAILKTIDHFDELCPDGGCAQACGTMLNCGLHECPQKCHQLSDHSKMMCLKILDWACSRGHKVTRPCFHQQHICRYCDEEDKELERRRKRDMELDAKRESQQKAYIRELTQIQDEILHERRIQKEERDNQERQRVLQQHHNDLNKLRGKSGGNPQGIPSNISRPSAPSTTPNEPQPAGSTTQSEPKDSSSGGGVLKTLSSAEQDWKDEKDYEGAKSDELDRLMSMIGLESIKRKFLNIKAQVDTALRQNIDFKEERFGSVLLGNPGTGKTTVARIYGKFLMSMGILPGSHTEETTGSRLANGGVSGCEKQINLILNQGGGVLFIDEAYQLTQSNGMGSQVLDYLLAEVERLTGKVVVILAGYRNQMEKFFAHNPGLPSRFPHEFIFEDYDETELRLILEYNIDKKFGGRMKVEGGIGGLSCRIVARRISRQRGHEGFGNARTVENNLSRILERQAKRLSRERKNKTSTDDFLLTMEDVIGPEPSKALQDCSAWRKLQEMIGLETVKDTVRALLDTIQTNYERELLEEPQVDFTLNRVFLGSPGTGKTTVAKLYGQILVDIGYLSNGEVVVKNPADFVGSVLGQSEQNTKGILASTVGKVLVIDEAYGLFGGGSRDKTGAQTNQFKTAVVDTMVAEVQSVPGDDRCVLLLGYEEQMTEMFQNVNPGLSRRFPMDAAFVFEDFSNDELGQILDLKLRQQGFKTSTQGRKVALEVLSRGRNSPHFGNAGEIDNLLNTAKIRQQKRRSSAKNKTALSDLQPQDFDPDYDRGDRGDTNIPMLFQGIVGCETIINQLEGYRQTVKNMRQLGMDPKEQVPFNFLFRGPPGTGKTSTARKMGKVYYDMGFLSSAEVIESSATDLIGEYAGHTGPKTQELLEKALGKVLLVDEAYRLADVAYAKEAMGEIVDCITKPKFFQKLIIILAGYDNDINRLMAINPGLTSRFPESLEFKQLGPDDCIGLLTNLLRRKKDKLDTFCIKSLEFPRPDFLRGITKRFTILARSANWANARDVETLSKAIFGTAVQTMQKRVIVITEDLIIDKLDHMISERKNRTAQASKSSSTIDPLQAPAEWQPTQTILTPALTAAPPAKDATEVDDPGLPVDETCPAGIPRDDGVSDHVWNQLQLDLQSAETRESDYLSLLKEEHDAQQAVAEPPKSTTDDPKANDEAKRQHEQRRLEELARRAKLEKLQKKREAEEAERRKERKIQQKLRHMGVCCMGYRWIRQASGYRCAGGSHFVSNENLGV